MKLQNYKKFIFGCDPDLESVIDFIIPKGFVSPDLLMQVGGMDSNRANNIIKQLEYFGYIAKTINNNYFVQITKQEHNFLKEESKRNFKPTDFDMISRFSNMPSKSTNRISFENMMQRNSLITSKLTLPIILGVDGNGRAKIQDLEKLHALLIAGKMGCGKTLLASTFICELLTFSPNIKFVLCNAKGEFLNLVDNINLWTNVIFSNEKFNDMSEKLFEEIDMRYTKFLKDKVSNIEDYNLIHPQEKMERIVCIVDDMNKFSMDNEEKFIKFTNMISKLGRVCGVHLVILANEEICARENCKMLLNFKNVVCFKVSNAEISKLFVEIEGAEKLNSTADILCKFVDDFFRLYIPEISNHILENYVRI